MPELLQADEAQVVHRDLAPLVVRQSRLQLEPEQDVAHHIEPGEQGRFLEHNKPLLARAGYALPISQDLAALGFGQAPGFTHKGLRSYALGSFGDVRLPDALLKPAKDETSEQT